MFASPNTSKISQLVLEDLQIPEADPLPFPVLQDKIRGILFGNALGDALGLRTEFFSTTSARNTWKNEELHLNDWPEYKRPFPRCDWTDDTDQMILILQTFLDSASVDAKSFAARLLDWKNHGFPELGDTVGLGIGSTVNSVLKHPEYLEAPFIAAFEIWENSWFQLAANGALMRTSVLGVINFQNLAKVLKQTIDIANVTHADPRCVASCVSLTSTIALHLQGHSFDQAFEFGVLIGKKTLKVYTEIIEKKCVRKSGSKFLQKFLNEKSQSFQPLDLEKYFSGQLDDFAPFDREALGFTYICLAAAFWAARQDDWTFAIREICCRGGDADTNAAVAGALLGAKLGFGAMPQELARQLKHFQWLWNMTDLLIGRVVGHDFDLEEKGLSEMNEELIEVEQSG